MGKTFRHRRSSPHGIKCVDNSSKEILIFVHGIEVDLEWWNSNTNFPTFMRGISFSKETRAARKRHWKSYRAQVANRLRHCDIDRIPRIAKTQGWMTH